MFKTDAGFIGCIKYS